MNQDLRHTAEYQDTKKIQLKVTKKCTHHPTTSVSYEKE